MRAIFMVISLILAGLASSAPAIAEQFILNTGLIEATRPANAVYGPDGDMAAYPGYRVETDYLPQDMGDVLYADSGIVIAAKTNFKVTGTRRVGYPRRAETLAIVQRPLCIRGAGSAKFWVGQSQSVPVHEMNLVAIIGETPDFQITRDWLWNTFRPKLRHAVTDRFCGGRTQVVNVDFHMFGLQHDFNGNVRSTVDTQYPTAQQVIDALNESSRPYAPTDAVSARAPFVSATYYFWDKIEPEYGSVIPAFETVPDTQPSVVRKTSKGLILPAGGAHPSQGSYFEAFSPRWAAGAGLSELVPGPNGMEYRFAESASYMDYLWGRKAELANNKAIMERREREKITLGEVIAVLGGVEHTLRCLPVYDDWGMVAAARDAWQERNCK